MICSQTPPPPLHTLTHTDSSACSCHALPRYRNAPVKPGCWMHLGILESRTWLAFKISKKRKTKSPLARPDKFARWMSSCFWGSGGALCLHRVIYNILLPCNFFWGGGGGGCQGSLEVSSGGSGSGGARCWWLEQTEVSSVRTKQMSSSNPGQGAAHKHPVVGGGLIACWGCFFFLGENKSR